MKKHLFISLGLLVALTSCSTNEELNRSDFKSLSFETFVGKGATRAAVKTAFADGNDFGVIAYRHGAIPWTDATSSWGEDATAPELFMENVKVTRQGGMWTYALPSIGKRARSILSLPTAPITPVIGRATAYSGASS
ncbi:MAG: fimbrillin family protein [Bacteroides sp.]|nr:fimbrillin family protein [Bacteroides sp.]